MMKDITFTIKVITPTLMGGGFGQNDGIRPSEIKGLMRYWFRAVAGSVIGDDIKTLKNLEEKVFGSQERKSPFRIVIERFNEKQSLEKVIFNNLSDGAKYLGFVLNMNKERLNNVIKAGSEFKVKFLFKNFVDEKIIKLVAYSFYLATALGGFGLRARRCLGSWQIIDVRTEGINENLDNLKDYDLERSEIDNIKKIIKGLKNLIEGLKDINNSNRNYNFKTINEDFIYIHRLAGNNWEESLDDLGNKYKNFRRNNRQTTPEYFNIKNFISNGCRWDKIRKNQWNFAFGLPIQLNSKGSSRISIKNLLSVNSRNILKVGSFKVKHNKEYIERLPSTAWFSIKEKNNQYYTILTYLEGKLFPDEEKDKIIFEFNKNLNLQIKCRNFPKSVEIEYDVNDLKEKAQKFLKEGL